MQGSLQIGDKRQMMKHLMYKCSSFYEEKEYPKKLLLRIVSLSLCRSR